MSIVSVILAPFALLLPDPPLAEPGDPQLAVSAQGATFENSPGRDNWADIVQRFRADPPEQVRIEQRTTIRIAPRRPLLRRDFLMDLPDREVGPRFIERKIGDCLQIGGIAGVQVSGGNRLVLFLRDRRMVSAKLERSCRARDFYSGFYVQRSTDGRLCVDRDTLLSRSGVNCKLTRIRQLIEVED